MESHTSIFNFVPPSSKLESHLVVVGVALGGDMAMYSEEPAAEGATGLALDTSEEYCVPPSSMSPAWRAASATSAAPPGAAVPPHSTGVYCTPMTGPECVRLWEIGGGGG